MLARLRLSLLALVVPACGGDWGSVDAPDAYGVSALWVSGPEDVWAGAQGLLHFDGGAFEKVELEVNVGFIADFWGFGPSDVYAVGGDQLLHFDGAGWSVIDFGDVISPAGLTAIWGTSGTDLWLGDSFNGQVHHFDGSTWRTTITQTVEVHDLWGSSSTDVYAVGIFGVSHWDGSRWTRVEDNATSRGDGVFGFSANDVWIVGDSATLSHFDGSTWTDVSRELDEEFDLSHTKVWGSSPTDVYAVGSFGLVSHFDGVSWTQTELGDRPYLQAIHGVGPDRVWIGGSSLETVDESLVYQRSSL